MTDIPMFQSSMYVRGVLGALLVVTAALAYQLYLRSDRIDAAPFRGVEGRLVGVAYGHRPALKARTIAARSNEGTQRGTLEALLRGETGVALQELEGCTRTEPENDQCWSDLAAVNLEMGRRGSDPRRFAAALVAADRALLIAPTRLEALFNRAIALESLSLAQPAAVAWRRYLTGDGDSQWAAEARERKAALEKPAASDLWNEAMARLEQAAKNGDARTIGEIVRSFPQETRTYGERRFTCDWEEALRKGDSKRAADRLALSRQIGAMLRVVNGEELLGDAIEAIDRAPESRIADFMNAYRAYGEGRALVAQRNATAARPLFESSAAVFLRLRSPMFRVAEYYLAGCLSDLGENDAAAQIVDRHLADVPRQYVALRAQLLWQKGIIQSRTGHVFESMDVFSEALEIFDAQGELSNAAQIRASLDVLHGSMGRDAEAWRIRLQLFDDVSRLGNPRVLQTALVGAAGAEAAHGRWDLAMAFYGVSIERNLAPGNPVHAADAAIWRALAAHQLGLDAAAGRGIVRARSEVAGLPDAGLRARSIDRLRLAEAVILRDRDPAGAVDLLNAVIADSKDLFRLPEAHLERGRAWREQGRNDEAIADFRQAFDLVQRREQNASTDAQRDSYFATADAAAEELIDLLDRQAKNEEAFAVAERSRSRSFAPAPGGPLDKIAVPEGILLAHYTALPDRLLIFLLSSDGTDIVRVAVTRAELEQRISSMTSAVADGAATRVHVLAHELHDLLIAPIGGRLSGRSRLVIVPDEMTARVPFAALRTASNRFLVELVPIAYAPSGGAFVRALRRAPASSERPVLAVGDPDFEQRLFPDLARLPAARAEANDLAKLLPSTQLLLGEAATPARVVEAMRSSRLIDIAAHAVLDRQDPARSALLLASSGDDPGILYMDDIADLAVPADVVMLAGCNTVAIMEDTPPALRSFALAFLAAGSRNVIGSLWAANDDAARMMSHLFHQNLRDGAAPAVALRNAQLAMLRSPDPRFRAPLAWSGYQLYGSGS